MPPLNEMALAAEIPKTPQIIINELKSRTAFLLIGEGSAHSFIVIKPTVIDGEKVCVVLAAYSSEQDAVVTCIDQVTHFAKLLGCEYLDFQTNRKGFSRLAPKIGFKQQFTVWRKPCETTEVPAAK